MVDYELSQMLINNFYKKISKYSPYYNCLIFLYFMFSNYLLSIWENDIRLKVRHISYTIK